ncbi:MAG TPA: calcium/proton exchanger [Thermomicrobiales bacterium]|nr:calcium/proton exchanger [Thermomicrobiales bacterium]
MKFLYALLLLVPVVLVLKWFGIGNDTLLFVLSALALIPLSAVLGESTEKVAEYTGPKIGGFLNATFGNAPELIITIVALREGLIDVVKASIAGSIIGNMLVVLGASILLGGLKHGEQRFDARMAATNASMMSLAIVILMIPAVFELGSGDKGPTHEDIVKLSDGASVVLIVLYGFYLLTTVFAKGKPHETTIEDIEERSRRGFYLAVGIMLAVTVSIVLMSEVLVGAIEPTAEAWGLSDLFIGLMLVPLVGNIAEHLVAVQMALRNKMDLSIAIAVGSGLQIALFVAPVLVLVSQFVGPVPMTLVFSSYELVALAGTVIVAVLISIDGRTRWLEGAQLLALYLVLGLAFYFVP